MEFVIFELENGIRVVHKQVKSTKVAHLGLFINAGSRDEQDSEKGLAHFIEHTIFKGTKKRKSFHILNRLDSVGGELEAYTTKEETVFHASFLKEHLNRAAELIADITFNSVFPKKEIIKEKDVIIDEIASYLDSPYDQIYDDFEELVFGKHPLGSNILGTEKHLKSFTQQSIHNFMNRLYATEEMVISSVGAFSEKRLKETLEKHFNAPIQRKRNHQRETFETYRKVEQSIQKDHYQSHYICGNMAYSTVEDKKNGMILLNNLIGGPAMNSILNMEVRERLGYTYNIESNYSIYSDCGLFSIYLGTDQQYLDKTIAVVNKALKKLRENELSVRKLSQAKKQIIGQMALGRENNQALMLSYGKSLMVHNRISTLEEIIAKVESITAQEVLTIANEILNTNNFSHLAYINK
ncbi:M16 family metallopeptidase [Acidiluteibacter ferrifornacis]|uniref:Insulinase family protein n=1 Tax=Acidiluteibacter ferrifornacis TaxID=2692424 RepID=A0A6N9NLH3_9FLAO|nr:pitrilysin family protein [Acidiluteibacter ferrifornacis]NBG66709.1 insulinase family protein [Acidiluteibacter ferrifornacis]